MGNFGLRNLSAGVGIAASAGQNTLSKNLVQPSALIGNLFRVNCTHILNGSGANKIASNYQEDVQILIG